MSCSGYLTCPVCGGALADSGGSARCAEGHAFDYASSGYLNLTRAAGGRARVGDTPAMVEARAEFLAGGHYRRVARAVAGATGAAAAGGDSSAPVLVEIGSGTGYYLDGAVQSLRERELGPACAIGFDLSKSAAAHAARRQPDSRFVVADVEAGIPLGDAVADVVLSVFSPRPGAELGRVVVPGGELIAAFAGPRHLERLRERLGLMGVHENKLDRLTERLAPWFEPVTAELVEYEVELVAEAARRLVLMGPNAWHDVDPEALGGGHADSVSVLVARFRRFPAGPGGVG